MSKSAIINRHTHPELSCVKATIMSCCIPFLFQQYKYKGNIYIDGALTNPYPIDIFDDGKTPILGIYIVGDAGESNEGVSWYFKMVINSPINELRRRIISASSPACKHIKLMCNDPNVNPLEVDDDIIGKLIHMGHTQAEIFVNSLKNNNSNNPLTNNLIIDINNVINSDVCSTPSTITTTSTVNSDDIID